MKEKDYRIEGQINVTVDNDNPFVKALAKPGMPSNEAVKIAYVAQTLAIAERTNVGCSLVTTDGNIFAGANLEGGIKKAIHAEEAALISGMMHSYRFRDFDYLVQIAFSKDEVYPCCLSCLAYLWDFTHPDFKIFVIHDHEVVYATTLKWLVQGFNGLEHVYTKRRDGSK